MLGNKVLSLENFILHSQAWAITTLSLHKCFLVAKTLWKTICPTHFFLQNRGCVIKIKVWSNWIRSQWYLRSDITTAYAIYFLSAEMHSDTTHGSHSARLKEMIVSQLTQRTIIILQGEKKSYFEVLWVILFSPKEKIIAPDLLVIKAWWYILFFCTNSCNRHT